MKFIGRYLLLKLLIGLYELKYDSDEFNLLLEEKIIKLIKEL